MEGDDLRTWNDLKSKAMGGPTSGLEPSDELLITAGLKEAPKAKAPKTRAENDGWMNGISTEEQQRLRTLLGTSENRSITAAEQDAGDSLNFSAGRQEQANFNQYLNEKAKLLGVDYPSILVSGQFSGTLRDDQTKAMADVLQTKLDEINLRDGTNLTLPDDIDRAEQEILSLNDSYLIKTYLRLKANALGTAPFTSYSTDSDIGSLNRWKERIEKSIASKQGAADAKKLFASKTPEEREDILEATRSSEDVGKALVKTGLMPKDAKINLQGVDHSLALSAAYSYNKVAEKFPFMVGEWHELSAKLMKNTTYACAYMASDSKEIDLNVTHFDDVFRLQSSYERDMRTGFHPAGTSYRSIVTHEIGHTLDGYLSKRGVGGSKLEITTRGTIKKNISLAGILKKRVLKEMKISTSDKKNAGDIARELSQYGTKDEQEWFAECFAEAMDSPNPRPMAATMMKHLTQILKDEGLING